MSTALADPPAAPAEQQQPSAGPAGGSSASASDAQKPSMRPCSNCAAPLTDGQDWCLQCGTGAPDSLGSRAPTWRSAAAILTTLAVLIAGAAGAAYAALSKDRGRPSPATKTIAQVPALAPASTPPVQPATPQGAPPTVTAKIGAPTTIKPLVPPATAKAPKIPLSAPTPATTPAATSPSAGETTTPPVKAPKSTQTPVPVGEAHPEALLLDTNAASTYNPYNYAASNFGDPSLAIDGDPTTGWTALVEPTVAPKLAEGLLIDLNTSRKLSELALTTTTPGMTIQVYGANGTAPPTSITDSAWIALSPSLTESKKKALIKFGGPTPAAQLAAKRAYRFVVLWISRAPESAVGTPQAPGRVSVNELELFARKK